MPPVDQAERTDSRTGTLPPPLRAGLDLVVTGVERARHLPLPGVGDLAGLPRKGVAVLSTARHLATIAYEELAHRGEDLVARLRHQDTPAIEEPPAAEAVDEVTDPFGLPEEIAEAVEEAPPGATLSHDQLPLDDYDHLTLGSLRARLARLDAVALVQLRDYERAHAHRLPVLTMLENRLAKIGATDA